MRLLNAWRLRYEFHLEAVVFDLFGPSPFEKVFENPLFCCNFATKQGSQTLSESGSRELIQKRLGLEGAFFLICWLPRT